LVSLLQGILLAVTGLAIAWLVLVTVLYVHRPSRELAGPALRLVPDLVRLVRALLADPETPRGVRLALGGLLAYLVFPIDLVPDFVPVLGSADDIILAALVLRWAGRRVGLEGLAGHWTGTEAGFLLLRRLLGI
jgi:uncharacterized membrane protein YkvA (DUF1232 family)